MIFKKAIKFIAITAFIAMLSSSYEAFAYDSNTPQPRTNLCSNCDNWFMTKDSSEHLCPRCALLKDLTLLRTDPDFSEEKLDPQKEYARREIEDQIETLEQSLWARPNLRWNDNQN